VPERRTIGGGSAVHCSTDGWDSFPWQAGIYVGPVASYGVLDVNGTYRLTKDITVGADVANLLNDDHYEAFGGDLLGRRALVHVTYSRRSR